MRPLFSAPAPALPSDTERAILARRPLLERLEETLRYLEEEIGVRQVGSLGEAQAAGYLAGRLQRAEQQATVTSFRTGVGQRVVMFATLALMAIASFVPVLLTDRIVLGGALLTLVGGAALLWSEVEGPGLLGQLLGRRTSQSVIGVRAAVDNDRRPHMRVVLCAPLDGAPQLAPRGLLLLALETAGVVALAMVGLLAPMIMPLRWLAGAGALALMGLAVMVGLDGRRRDAQAPMLGAGEMAALIAVAEELGELRQVELWSVALGGATAGDTGMRRLLERYPFGADTCFLNLHHMTDGQPVFVTREGVFRELRSDRELLAVASQADAADVSINAEPRMLNKRTLAALPLRRRFRAITLTTHTQSPSVSPNAQTLERCVRLIVGMIRELDRGD